MPRDMAVKRVSADEKLEKLVNFFREQPDVYTLKELEKKIPKHCGIPAMKMPEVLQSAIDEDMIHCDKIGSTNIYWSFKMERQHHLMCEIEKAQAGIAQHAEENERKEEHARALSAQRDESAERTQLKIRYSQLKKQLEDVKQARELADKFSAATHKANEEENAGLREEVNRLTDAIFTVQGYVCNKFGMSRREFNDSFHLDEEMDYVEAV